jgi:hypothetical protein
MNPSNQPNRIAFAVAIILWTTTTLAARDAAPSEPNAEAASAWWPEMENTWVPIGWKDHLLRFNVLYNGTVIGQPVRYPTRGQGLQLTFLPSRDGEPPASIDTEPYQLRSRDGGVGDQTWTENAAPLLRTRLRQDGVILCQEVFAHVKDGGPLKTGTEAIFAWIRLSAEASPPGGAFVLVRINKPHLLTEMDRHKNLTANRLASAYPCPLRLESSAKQSKYLLLDDVAKVRLAIAPGSQATATLIDQRPARPDTYLKIAIAAAERGYVDLLVPLVPENRDIVDAELALGHDAALREADRFWAAAPPTASRIDTPERLVNEAARQAVRFCEVIAERHPGTGQYSLLSGSWHYERLWATPTSMSITMILDGLGHHPAAEKYLEIFRQEQGTISPPGNAYHKHAGYLATPRTFTSIDWLTDHGAILHAAAHHAMVTDEPHFTERWTEPILKACEFIRDFRKSSGHGGVEGLLPAAVPTDTGVQEQSVWTDGWNYKGLCTSVRFLRRIHHPRAEEFAREAIAYRESFRRAMRAAVAQMPEWTDSDGRKHRFVPTALPKGGDLTFPFYLDTGPLFLVYSGLMNADDDLMRLALHYFRAGPNRRTYDLDGAWHQPVCLHHEISSCEPCYSWNVFHAWQAGDRPRFLEGMYSLLAGSMSRRTFIGCEHRGGVSGTLFSVPLPIELARLAAIDDQLEPNQLHLLRLVPLAWLRADRPTGFERIPTEFGPVTLQFQLKENGHRLLVTFKPQFRHDPQSILLHVPPLDGLREVAIGDRLHTTHPGNVIMLK